jgi:peptidoglycan-associated lipoprotein
MLVVGIALALVAGCARKPIEGVSAGDKIGGATLGGPSVPLAGVFKPSDAWIAAANWTLLPKVFFDYDRAVIRESERGKLEQVAEYLKAHPQDFVLVAGHCDERGTSEYNRALGERRASAAREYLIRLGISAERIETISYGEDKPAVEGHDESAWAQNRRAEFGVGPLQLAR